MFSRLIDIILSVSALVLISPIFAATCVVLRFTGEHEVFYNQLRIGKNFQKIKILKFATMLKDSPNLGSGEITLENDPRVLPIGKILRKTKINELPQILNVLVGDMSLIGPRPQTKRCFDAYGDEVAKIITTVRPGLSGIGSIIFRNEEKMISTNLAAPDKFYDDIVMKYKGELEIWYVRKRCISLDIILIILTVWVVFVPDSKLIWKIFRTLPAPPKTLEHFF